MTPETLLSHGLLLPELELKTFRFLGRQRWELDVRKKRLPEVCPRCATLCRAGYDRRVVRIKDDPIRDKRVRLIVEKRRLWCPVCRKPFTECRVPGNRTQVRLG